MMSLVNGVLVGWIVLGVALFRFLPARRAVLIIAIAGLLFLPEVQTKPANPEAPTAFSVPCYRLTKLNALATALLVGSLWYDRSRWRTVQPRWFDLPMLVWCLSPAIATVGNTVFYDDPVSSFDPALLPSGMGPVGWFLNWLEFAGVYDALSQTVDQFLIWGVPYWMGRLYFADREGLRDLAFGFVLGGLAYVPFCLVETRMSPQFHKWVYGFHPHDFTQTQRLGGYRPTAFMEHGLALGMWMTVATLAGFWLWWTGQWRTVPLTRTVTAPSWLAVLVLAGTTILCKSTGALVLGLVGVAVLLLSRQFRVSVPVAMLLIASPLYVAVRTEHSWDGREVVEFISEHFDDDRAASLAFRFRNEDLLIEKALGRPTIGWGGWGRSHVYDSTGKDITVTDGLWIIAFGERGFLGLTALGLVFLLPSIRHAWRFGGRGWAEQSLVSASLAAVVLGLVALDSLMNAMLNPVFMVLAGGLVNLPTREAVPLSTAVPRLTQPRVLIGRTESVSARPLAGGSLPALNGRV